MTERRRILLIRRDNIGDLVCTTPLFAALRARYPDAYIALLANTYCAPVVAHNPHLDRVYVYAKAKHLRPAQRPAAYWARVRLVQELRKANFDDVILAAASYYARGLEFARWLPKARVIGFASEHGEARGLDVALSRDKTPRHEVEDLFQLLAPFDVRGTPPATALIPDPTTAARVQGIVRGAFGETTPLAIHISARLPSNRWHSAGYVALIRALILEGHQILLLWAPGEPNDPAHPGDDALARQIEKSVASPQLLALPTHDLATLVAAFHACRGAILSDGGGMHIAAALKKPVVCFFGDSDVNRWHPWNCPHILLQPPSRNVVDIPVSQVLDAAHTLFLTTS
ncbi:MAG: glycosyltransferase family 9 protein [Acidiferrobacter sp.]